MDRRKFLQTSITVAGTSILPGLSINRVLAQEAQLLSSSGKKLVFIFLRGGADSLGFISPSAGVKIGGLDVRPDIKITGGIPIYQNSPLVLNPEFSALFADLKVKESLNFVLHCGSKDETRSHFLQQDLIETGTVGVATSTGFLARAANLIPYAYPVDSGE